MGRIWSILQDVVIVNKIDSLGKVDEGSIAQRISDLENEIHQINSLAKIVRTEHCRVNWSEILECRAYDKEVKLHMAHLYYYLLSLRKTHSIFKQLFIYGSNFPARVYFWIWLIQVRIRIITMWK